MPPEGYEFHAVEADWTTDNTPRQVAAAEEGEGAPTENPEVAALWRFKHEVDSAHSLLHLAMRGIAEIRGIAEGSEALREYYQRSGGGEVTDEEIEAAREISQLAATEVAAGFPLLQAQYTMTVWSALETLVEDLVVARVRTRSTVSPDLRIRVTLNDLLGLDEDERALMLARELARSLSADLKPGITGFETILSHVGLGGRVHSSDRRTLLEMHQVRNLFAHRSGIVDRKFLDACPWVAAEVGDAWKVSHEDAMRYEAACRRYWAILIERSHVAAGGTPRGFEPQEDDDEAAVVLDAQAEKLCGPRIPKHSA